MLMVSVSLGWHMSSTKFNNGEHTLRDTSISLFNFGTGIGELFRSLVTLTLSHVVSPVRLLEQSEV